MEQSVEKIIGRNLLEVFNGRDADSRRAAIDELWNKDGRLCVLGPWARAIYTWRRSPTLVLWTAQ
jgi:hypothetical protein